MTTVLQICQQASRRLGLKVPTTVASAVDAKTLQLGELLQEVCEYLVEVYNWQTTRFTKTFVAVDTSDQGTISSLTSATSFKRIVPNTFWNLTTRLPFYGPVGAQNRQAIAAMVPQGPTWLYWITHDHLFLSPTPTAGDSLSFEWDSKDCFLAADGTTRKAVWNADDDTPLFDESMLKVGLRAFWRREKGLSYADLIEQFEALAQNRCATDGTKAPVSLDCPERYDIVPGIMVPAGSWNP